MVSGKRILFTGGGRGIGLAVGEAARTAGAEAAVIDPSAAIAERVRSGAESKGKPFGLSAAEYLRGHAVDLRT